MKNKIPYIWIITLIVQTCLFTACKDENEQEPAAGLTLKAYTPTVVMAGGEMVITGSSLDRVNTILFPGEIKVTDFDVVTSNQIKVTIPAGIDEEGGFLQLISADKTIESTVAMRLARPRLKSMDPGDEVSVGQELTFKGEDLEYIKQVIFPAKEENQEIVIETIDFVRKASGNLKVKVPADIKNGMNRITLVALDRTTLISEEINLITSATTGGSVLWEGEVVIGGWDNGLDLDVEYFRNLEVGNKLRFYFEKNEDEGWWQIKVSDDNWEGFPGLDATGLENYPDGYADLFITQDIYDRIMQGGIHVQGANFTLTKVELI